MRVLELFCGIGGCAAALEGAAEMIAAVDINLNALGLYQANFPHPVEALTIESITADQYSAWDADLWWLSPPCQPYTARGRCRDLDDPRAASLVMVIRHIRQVRPQYVALENVPGFEHSRAHAALRAMLDSEGYQVREIMLCPTQLGVPNRRRRFYLVASQHDLCPWPAVRPQPEFRFSLADILDSNISEALVVPDERIAAYRGVVHVVDASQADAVSCCFTSAYGRSMASAGSYVKTDRGYRRFAPREICRLLCFPEHYRIPPELPAKRLWPLLGNSLSVTATRFVLSAIPELTSLRHADVIRSR